jgi:hypothetical protein
MDCEVWICIDAEGEYACGTDCDTAKSRYTDDISNANVEDGSNGIRMVKVTVYIPLPTVATVQATAPPLPAVGVTAVV